MNKKDFQEQLLKIHNNTITCNDLYINAKTKIRFVCHCKDENDIEHGEFFKTPYEVIKMGRKCPECYNIKPKGFWNNKEHVIEEAKKFHNKYEFQLKSSGAYRKALQNGWLDEIALIYDATILYGNMEDKVHVVYVYEFPNKVCYVGRTKNIKRRHRQHSTYCKHKDGSLTCDCVLQYAIENKLEIPFPKIIKEKLNGYESQECEEEILNEYLANGWTPLNKGVCGIGKSSMGARILWTYDACKEEAKKYENKNKMKEGNQSAYNAAVKNKWISDFFPTNANKEKGYWTLDKIQEIAKQYKNASSFRKDYSFPYHIALKNKWNKLIKYKKNTK